MCVVPAGSQESEAEKARRDSFQRLMGGEQGKGGKGGGNISAD